MSEHQSRPKARPEARPEARPRVRHSRFHGRVVHEDGRRCESPGCAEAGEFRAPRSARPECDGYHWFCLEHVRAFNAGYDYFKRLSPEEAASARTGHPSWDRASRPFATNADPARAGSGGIDPSRMKLHDPHGLFTGFMGGAAGFSGRFGAASARSGGVRLSAKDRQALKTLGLDEDATLESVKKQYKKLARRYHPDTNGGDRSQEHELHKVIDAYTHLSQSPAFSS